MPYSLPATVSMLLEHCQVSCRRLLPPPSRQTAVVCSEAPLEPYVRAEREKKIYKMNALVD